MPAPAVEEPPIGAGPVGRPLVPGRGRPRGPAAALGVGGLAATVCASAYLAIGAAGGGYLLDLPVAHPPGWIYGPLRGLAGGGEWLQPSQLSAALIVMLAGYLLALAFAGAVGLRLAMGAVVIANLAFVLGPTIVSSDVFGYIAYGRELARHGLDPYVSPPLALGHEPLLSYVYWKHQPSPYGPLFSMLGVPLGLSSVAFALWSYKVLAGAAAVAITALLARLARERGLDPTRAAIFAGLNPAILFYGVSGAHNDLLAVCLVVLGLALTLRGLERRGAAAAVAGAAIKLTVGLALPFILLAARRRGQALRGAVLAGIVLAVPTLILFGGHFVSQLHRIATDPLFDTLFSGPDRVAWALGTHITPAIRTLCTAGAGLVTLIAVLRVWRGSDAVTAAGWAFLALLASIASFAPWYLLWLLPFAALGRSRSLRSCALLLSVFVIAVHLPALGGVPWLSQAPGSSGRTTRIAVRPGGAAQRPGLISWTLPAPASATSTSPLRVSTATLLG